MLQTDNLEQNFDLKPTPCLINMRLIRNEELSYDWLKNVKFDVALTS